MTPQPVPSPLRRFMLPVICGVLAIAAATYGESVLVEQAGQPTVGPLVAAQIAYMMAFAFATLCVVTLLLAIFPGRDHAAHDQEDEGLRDEEDLEADADDELHEEGIEDTDSPSTASALVDRSSEDIIASLRRSASKQAAARQAADTRTEEALARVAELEEQLAEFRSGVSPEAKAFRAQCREEASRDAMRKVHELSEMSDRLTGTLKEGKARAEEALVIQKGYLAERDEELRAAIERAPEIRQEGAAEEYLRVRIAVQAVNETHVDVLDPMQRDAVRRHAERIDEAIIRLNPNVSRDANPGIDMPPLLPGLRIRRAVSAESVSPRSGGKRKRSRWGRRSNANGDQ